MYIEWQDGTMTMGKSGEADGSVGIVGVVEVKRKGVRVAIRLGVGCFGVDIEWQDGGGGAGYGMTR
jgi:hypothetical protein